MVLIGESPFIPVLRMNWSASNRLRDRSRSSPTARRSAADRAPLNSRPIGLWPRRSPLMWYVLYNAFQLWRSRVGKPPRGNGRPFSCVPPCSLTRGHCSLSAGALCGLGRFYDGTPIDCRIDRAHRRAVFCRRLRTLAARSVAPSVSSRKSSEAALAGGAGLWLIRRQRVAMIQLSF